MTGIPCTNPDESTAENATIEVHLTPEYSRQLLAGSMNRTQRRAAGLLADLMTACRSPTPDPTRIRELAEGLDFERRLAQRIRLAMPVTMPTT
jgi:hypothetical protein